MSIMEPQNNLAELNKMLEYVNWVVPQLWKAFCLVLVPKAPLPEKSQQLHVGYADITPD